MEKERSRKSISSSVEKEETCQEGKVFFTFQSAWANPKKVQFSLDEPYCRLSQWLKAKAFLNLFKRSNSPKAARGMKNFFQKNIILRASSTVHTNILFIGLLHYFSMFILFYAM